MTACSVSKPVAQPGGLQAQGCSHELRSASLHDPGRGLVVPCDALGHVDLDTLSERLRAAYLGARAMVGRDYAYPTVQRPH